MMNLVRLSSHIFRSAANVLAAITENILAINKCIILLTILVHNLSTHTQKTEQEMHNSQENIICITISCRSSNSIDLLGFFLSKNHSLFLLSLASCYYSNFAFHNFVPYILLKSFHKNRWTNIAIRPWPKNNTYKKRNRNKYPFGEGETSCDLYWARIAALLLQWYRLK